MIQNSLYRANWGYRKRFLSILPKLLRGRTLNFPCGMSPFGEVRADIDPSVKPDVIADFKNPPFRRGSFDTLWHDPPYSVLNRPGYLTKKLIDIPMKRFVLEGPVCWRFRRSVWSKSFFVWDDKSFFMRLLQIFDRKTPSLEIYL